MSKKDLEKKEQPGVLEKEGFFSVQGVLERVHEIKRLMREGMQQDEHYGIIPGTKKNTLYKSGAEKLNFMFRLVPEYEGEIKPIDLGNGHREFIIKCQLRSVKDDKIWGQGLGSCSTLEKKFRYRSDEPKVELTQRPVEKIYWQTRKAPESGLVPRKDANGVWMWARIVGVGDRVENPDIADCYNTVLKMAKKRAYVDATISSLGVSDLFTQDIEEGKIREAEETPKEKEVRSEFDAPPELTPKEKADKLNKSMPQPILRAMKDMKWGTEQAFTFCDSHGWNGQSVAQELLKLQEVIIEETAQGGAK